MISYRALLRALLITGVSLAAQEPSVPDALILSGSVSDSATTQPIPHANVTVLELSTQQTIRTPADVKASTRGTVKTGSDGRFRVVLSRGVYRISADAQGYVRRSRVADLRDPRRTASLDLALDRHGVISGRLIDYRRRAPVEGVSIQAMRTRFFRGRKILMPESDAVRTDRSGDFEIGGLPPGNYVLELAPTVPETVLPSGKANPAADVTRTRYYRRHFYPEGSADDALGIQLNAAARLSVGNIEVTAEPAHHIIASVIPDLCSDSGTLTVLLVHRYGAVMATRGHAKLPCKGPFTVANVAPGTYDLAVWISGQHISQRASAHSEVVMQDDDIEITVQPRLPISLNGRLEFSNPATDAASRQRMTEGLQVRLSPTKALGFAEERPAHTAADGSFAVSLIPSSEIRISLLGLSAPYYLKEIFYNGSRLHGAVFQPNLYAMEHSLALVVGEDGATISGSVLSDGKPLPEAVVVAVPWPLRYEEDFPVFTPATCDAQGRFEMKAVPPGRYRFVAVAPSAAAQIHAPGVLSAWAEGGQDVLVASRESKVIRLGDVVHQ